MLVNHLFHSLRCIANPLLLLRLAETSTVNYNKVVIMMTVTMVFVITPAGIDKLSKVA